MDTILHKLRNNGVGVYSPNPELLGVMTGGGLGYTNGQITRDINNFRKPLSAEAITAGKVLPSEALAREWVLAQSEGGLTYVQAIDLFTRWIQERRGYTANAVIDNNDLPYHISGNGVARHATCNLPSCHDRYFRTAIQWDDSASNKCRCDMGMARDVHLGVIRVIRNAALVAKDVEFIRAVEDGSADAQATIRATKQALRDIPATLDLATDVDTPELLKARWPTELPARE
jgi:hypothetical protein